MAIDSAEDRRSAGGVAFLPLTPGVTLNATPDSEWRRQAGWSYSGIGITSPSTGGAGEEFTKFVIPRVRRRHGLTARARR
jgi:hypothetical protein